MKTISSTFIIMPSSYISLSLPISVIVISIVFSFAHSSSVTMGGRRRSTYFNKIYAFGDSFTDTGNTNTFSGPAGYQFVSNYPYGKTFFHYPTNRYSDGRLVIDFVAQALSLPYLPPYLHINSIKPHGVNFAVAGATAIEHNFFVRNNVTLAITPQSLQTQLGWFEKLVNRQGCINSSRTRRRCKNVFDEALIWVGEIGVNDYAYTLASFVSTETVRQLSIKSLTVFLKTLLNKGAKYVVVQGMPPTGCLTLPMQISSEFDRDALGCVGSVNAMSYIHNNILKARLKELRKMFPNATIVYADYWHAYRYIMKNADKYHFFQRFRACCGSGADPYNLNMLGLCGSIISSSCANPSQYINWDGVHLTEAMYKAISQLFLRGTSTRPSFDYLLNQKMKSTS